MDETGRPLSIVIFCQYFFPENFGINTVAADLASRGHQVTVLTGMPNYPSGRFASGYGGWKVRREIYRGVRVVRVPIIARGQNSQVRLALNYLSYAISASMLAPFLLRRRPDVLLVYQLSPVTIALPAIVTKGIMRCGLLLWVQDIWPESVTATAAIKSRSVLGVLRWLVRQIYRRSTVIAVQSPHFIDFIRPLAPPDADFRYLPNTVDAFYRAVEVAPDAPERSYFRSGFTIVFAGNLGLAQDLEEIVGAIALLKNRRDIQWIFIGDGQRRGWLEGEIRDRRLAGNAQVIGSFPPEQMPTFFALADVLLMTLRDEAIFSLTVPSKLQSYLACGRPVLGAVSGAAAEALMESGAGLVALPGNAGSLAEAAVAMADMPAEQRRAMGRAALQYHALKFDRHAWLGRLEQWLRELASGPTSSAA
ncbi:MULTISPECIES: glycosyltransferase family 4 protein [Bradyrhizobium]|uniref:Glycosyltransferase involved in cell wall bisynthesis n=2 Tax=Bradyrhizobium TaxID=374 RepID=A0ABY0Q986_9BRAD|nr:MULTISPECIES: glycosyltransferase family 4 protein [Bradyrhizobium]SDJ71793.1 Glycosyltransferase involved in cell wall bisynthesis [Bradyrhizobium ottawaense]SEC21574.1 Glycosyltransferase involved in cell wall bisynthesis [Bradyrhizobium lablabi]